MDPVPCYQSRFWVLFKDLVHVSADIPLFGSAAPSFCGITRMGLMCLWNTVKLVQNESEGILLKECVSVYVSVSVQI